jgi:hypothetical protein
MVLPLGLLHATSARVDAREIIRVMRRVVPHVSSSPIKKKRARDKK